MRSFIPMAIAASFAAVGLSAGLNRAKEPTREDHTAAMQGVWAIEAFTLDGNTIPPKDMKQWRRIVKGNHVTWKNRDATMIELDINFDPTQMPMTLDSTIATGKDKGQTLLAIYELKGDKLRVCFAHPGKSRPKEFSSAPGSEQSLYVARRLKQQ
jgi:uncharacterized protein (TIGR03067 family)